MKCAVPFHSGVESRFGKRILDAIAVFLTTWTSIGGKLVPIPGCLRSLAHLILSSFWGIDLWTVLNNRLKSLQEVSSWWFGGTRRCLLQIDKVSNVLKMRCPCFCHHLGLWLSQGTFFVLRLSCLICRITAASISYCVVRIKREERELERYLAKSYEF
jgi:hypothetical protein